MALRKTAIAVPADVLAAVDAAARLRSESRSAFITRVLRAALRARRDREITRRLDALFADEDLGEEQRTDAEALDSLDGSWEQDERW